MLAALLDLLAPPLCWGCRSPSDGPLCAACRAELVWIEPRAPSARGSAIDALWSPLEFGGPARALVHALKFSAATGLAAPMAQQIVDALPPTAFSPSAVLVAVPAHRGRRARRGFDHAELLAEQLSVRVMLNRERALHRHSASVGQQRGLGRRRRLAGEALRVSAGAKVPDQVILVDDVCTTGATLERCARALRSAGSSAVSAVTYSRVK